MALPKIIVDKRGYLRVKTPSGDILPDMELKIINSMSDDGKKNSICTVVVTFIAEHDLKNNE